MQLGFVAALTALTVSFVARDAFAFCRTTTEKSPPDYDSASGGCWGKGVPLFWKNACVGYSIHKDASKKIAYEEAADAMSTAFTRWTGATCPTDGNGRSRTSIDVRDLGPSECGTVEYVSGVPNQNVILFRDDTWKYGKQVLGLTTVVYAPDTGEIYNADMEMNTLDMEPLFKTDPVPNDGYDLGSVVTHEAGHFLGVAHSDVLGAVMFARYDTGQTSMRNLAPDDVSAICAIYRPDGDRAVLDKKITQAPQCDPTPRGGYAVECQKRPTGCGGATSSTSPARPDITLTWSSLAAGIALAWARRRKERR